jgi:hypothetical protein
MNAVIRGRVFKYKHGTWAGMWAYEVSVNGEVVSTDNVNSWRDIFDDCHREMEAYWRARQGGQHFHTWAELMDDDSPSVVGDPEGLAWYSPAHSSRTRQDRYGWHLAGTKISDRDAAMLVASGSTDAKRAAIALLQDGHDAEGLVAAVVAAHS